MLDRIDKGDRISLAGAVLLLIGLFLPWYGVDVDAFGGDAGGAAGEILREFTGNISIDAFEAFSFSDLFLFALAVGAGALIVLIALGKVDDSNGIFIAVIGLAAAAWIILRGVLVKPADGLSLKWGLLVALIGAVGIAAGQILKRAGKI